MIYKTCGKRLLDLILASIGLIILSPIFAITALAVRFKLGSPIIYSQRRPGHNAVPFTLYKFRTMTNAKDNDGNLLPDFERITPLGKFLRSTSLDELPELWNVIKGDMSLVGPRPLLMEYLDKYTPQQARRHEAKPGITGWAQINGRNTLSWEERFKMDVWYIENQSFWLDLKILFLTLWKVLNREGIHEPGHVTMTKFSGSEADE